MWKRRTSGPSRASAAIAFDTLKRAAYSQCIPPARGGLQCVSVRHFFSGREWGKGRDELAFVLSEAVVRRALWIATVDCPSVFSSNSARPGFRSRDYAGKTTSFVFAGSVPKPKADTGSEISQMESAATFKVRVNLVQVRVIVPQFFRQARRQSYPPGFSALRSGQAPDHQQFLRGTAQTRLQRAAAVAKTQEDASATGDGLRNEAACSPERFVALVFDDTHLSLQDATFARSQAGRFLDSTGPTDRVGIYTTSGQNTYGIHRR